MISLDMIRSEVPNITRTERTSFPFKSEIEEQLWKWGGLFNGVFRICGGFTFNKIYKPDSISRIYTLFKQHKFFYLQQIVEPNQLADIWQQNTERL